MINLKLDTQALENLMKGDDGKIKLELQQAVVEEFSRRHIKAIVNDEVFRLHADTIREESMKNLSSMFGEWKGNYGNKKLELNPQMKEIIQLQAKATVSYELDQVEEHVRKIYTDTANQIKSKYEEKLKTLESHLEHYTSQLESHVEKAKEKLLTEQVDGIIRTHLKSILSETFATSN